MRQREPYSAAVDYSGEIGVPIMLPVPPVDHRSISIAPTVLAAFAGLSLAPLGVAQAGFVSAVTATKPIAYFQLNAASGKSEAGNSTYKSQGGVSTGSPSARGSQYAKFNGQSGMIVTTQSGGVNTA